MRVAIDTNVIVRNANRADAQHAQVARRLRDMVASGDEVVIAAQCVFEFWVVATRPIDVNGLGLSPEEARRGVDDIVAAFVLLPDPVDLLTRWLDLCERHEVMGRQAHDARLAAWALSHGITRLFTLNPRDFARFDGLECLGPS